MTKCKVYHYTVEGSGAFPFDMLRYDAAYPEREDEVGLIARCRHHSQYNEIRQIRMVSHSMPTVGRWNSFGWKVGTVEIIG